MDFIMIAINDALRCLILFSYTSQCQQRYEEQGKNALKIKRQRWIIIMSYIIACCYP
jgi:hypothetical protein